MLKNLLFFLKTVFCRQCPVSDNFAILNNHHDKELESRIKRLELASLTILKRLIQLKSLPNELLVDNHIADDTKQPTIH